MTNEATRLAEECKLLLTRAMTAQADAREIGDYTASKLAHTDACAAIDALATLAQPAVSEEARDAARYRWLRKNACNYSDGYDGPQLAMRTHGPDWTAEIDAAIDAAMASQEKPHD